MAQYLRKKKTGTSKTIKNSKGYLVFADSGTSVHRWAAAKKIGRKLKPGEVVHHKDRDKSNNSPNNLQVCKNQQEHWGIHKKAAKKHGWAYSLTGKRKKG